jgi:nucleotide-binding universal stress UspA family protein
MPMLTNDVRQAAVRAPNAGDGSVRRLMVAFDGSPGSWAALQRAIEIAVSNRSLLTIAAVVEEPLFFWQGPGAMGVPYTRESLRRELEGEMARHLANARDEVPATVSVTTQLLRGRAAKALAAFAEERGYDLIVTGPRPTDRLSRLLRVSVTQRLLARGHTSVLAVKAP